MQMQTTRLSVKVASHRGHGLPLRQLSLTCAVTNPTSKNLLILDAWIRVETMQGLALAEGTLPHMLYALADPPVILPGAEATAIITIPLPDRVLHELEQRRAGGDLGLRISSRVMACEAQAEGGRLRLTRPITTLLEDTHSGQVEYTIPQSEWVKVLRAMQWSEFMLLELPSRDLRSDERLARALKRLEDARTCFQKGLWEETAVNCRKAFEAMVKDTTGEPSMAKAQDAFNALIPEPSKAALVNQLVKDLGEFLQLARHENLPVIPFAPSDAAMAPHLTAALLAYLVAPPS